MERALVSAATGVLSPVIGKLAKLLEHKYDRFTGVRREVTSLRGELEHMHAFLQKLSWVEHPDVQTKLWMTEVKELSYDIEDRVDEFLIRVDGKTDLEGFKGFMWRIANFFIKIKTRWRIGKEIEGLQALVKRAGELRLRYKIDDNISEPHDESLDSRVCSIFKDRSELVGIDGPKEELISMLIQGDEVANQELKVFSIVGPGGLGKTTLANEVYNTHGKKFQCYAFVTVSRNPNVMKILRSILSQVTYSCPYGRDELINSVSDSVNPSSTTARAAPQFHGYPEDRQQLMIQILNFLISKRYFIVVDDIWDVQTWEIIKCVLPINSCGSIVITTTRKNEVAENCCFQHRSHIYALRRLNLEDSKKLFLERIFGHGQHCPPYLESICSTILKKCGGLPLALIVVSGSLANKTHTTDQWNRVQNSIGHGMQRSDQHVRDMFTILSLSYFDLPHHLKSCLLYLSIFPENYAIDKKKLVRKWIAEGFIPEEQDYTIYESGEKCFYELINRYLLQPARTNKFGEVKVCRVHDIILDFIVSKSTEENFISLFGNIKPTRGQEKKVRRISVQDIDQECSTSLTVLNLSHARSVTVFGDLGKLPRLVEFRIIRLLDLQDCDLSKYNHGLDSIGKLFWLKYLNLKNTNLSQLPKKIVELRNLETLNLKRNNIRQLPKSVVRLRQMICLLIDVNVKLPNGIGKMQALQELKQISVLEQPSIFAKELSQLTDLQELSLSLEPNEIHTGRYNECTETMVSSICRLGTLNLHSLSISIGEGCDDGFLQRPWCPPPSSLRRFVIKKKYPVSRVPSWLDSSLVNLQELCLHTKAVKQEDIQILGAIPALHRLVLYVQADEQDEAMVAGSSNFHLEISGSHGFSLLRYLKIDGTDPRRLGLRFHAGSMPKLEELVLMFKAFGMPDLKNVDLVFGLEHLELLAVFICEIDCYPPFSITREVEEAVQGVEEVLQVMDKLTNILGGQLQDAITKANCAPPEDLVEAIQRICTTHPKCPKLVIRKTGKNPLFSLLEFWAALFHAVMETRRSETDEFSLAMALVIITAITVLATAIRARERDDDEVTPATSDNELLQKLMLKMPFLVSI
ncbi:unnamed protein product [Urochloa decumbens]|uniref:Disease resistance protein RPM1 n=1 Tax=Urochloa decumbens TaxID=240449 RepID=A0ABC9CY90_9POAL